MVLGTGFPDFIAFRTNKEGNTKSPLMKGFCENCKRESFGYDEIKGFISCNFCGEHIVSTLLGKEEKFKENQTKIIGVEVKSNGYLDEVERDMCRWLIQNNVFSEILIAKKGEKRGEIEYIDFYKKHNK